MRIKANREEPQRHCKSSTMVRQDLREKRTFLLCHKPKDIRNFKMTMLKILTPNELHETVSFFSVTT